MSSESATSPDTFVFVSTNEHDTRVLGRHIGRLLGPATVIGMTGTLGSGKTRLTKAIAEGLGIDSTQVNSPTFTLSVPHTSGRIPLLHVDAYRLAVASEIDQLGLDEWVEDGGVLVIEWADKFATVMPPTDLSIHLESIDPNQRRIRIRQDSIKAVKLVAELRDLTLERRDLAADS